MYSFVAVVAVILGTFLGIVILSVLIYTYKLNKRYKRRKYLEDDDDDELYFTHRGQPLRYPDPSNTELKYIGYRNSNADRQQLIDNHRMPVVNQTNGHPRVSRSLTISLGFSLDELTLFSLLYDVQVQTPTSSNNPNTSVKLSEDVEEEGETTSQNDSDEASTNINASESDDQNVDDKVYYGFFQSMKATTSEVTLMTDISSARNSIQLVSNGLVDDDCISSNSVSTVGVRDQHVHV